MGMMVFRFSGFQDGMWLLGFQVFSSAYRCSGCLVLRLGAHAGVQAVRCSGLRLACRFSGFEVVRLTCRFASVV